VQDQRVAIVTGASRGIGRATAVAFARGGYAVVLAARGRNELTQAAGQCRAAAPAAEAIAVPTDVSKQDQVEALVAQTLERFGRIDVLVNNAGFGVHARVHETDEQDLREITEANFYGVFYGCKAAAPVMIRRRSGHIFNVSSVIGRRGTPFNGAYCATKAAVIALTEAMRVEMIPHGVHVTSVLPGLTETEFFERVRGGSSLHKTSFARIRGLMPPEKVARRIVRTVGRNKPELVFSLGGKLLIWVHHRFPRLADRMMKYYHDDLMRKKDEI